MKKTFLLCALCACFVMFTSCSSEEETSNLQSQISNQTQVTHTFSPFEMSSMVNTRAATSIATIVTRLDVWLYESGTEFTSVHQVSTDDNFGTITATLDKTKTYTLYAVDHKATDAATLADGVISFPDDKVTHSMFYTTTFSPSTTTSLSCLMNRIVSMFSFNTTDAVPDDAAKIQITIGGVYDRWNVTSGATHQLDRTSTFQDFTTRQDGTVTFNVYAITTDAQTLHLVTVTALNASDEVVQTRVFTDVPLRNGYKTTYQGVYFTDTETTATFTIGDWNEYDVVNF